MSWNRKNEEILRFWFCLEILSLTCDFCSNQTVFWGLEQNCFFIIFSKNINILVAKTCDFPQKRFCFVDKSTPSISRISLPKNGHHFCGHLELFFTRKITKSEQNWWFSATLWWPTFPIRPCPIYLWKSSHPPKITSTLDKLFTKKYKKCTFFVVF